MIYDVLQVPHELRDPIQKFIQNYEKALTLRCVRNPLPYALYKTWREYDAKK